jgi:drug/metabolite transporter (DMT)-like permease
VLKKNKNFLLLHLIVFIWGFTGILGHLISLSALNLVWYRILIAVFSIFFFNRFFSISIKTNLKNGLLFTLTGLIIALHWIFFFQSIKVSNISVTLACLSAATLFTAILEPIIKKRKIIHYEIILGITVIIGLGMIFKFETKYHQGIFLTLFSASMSSLFTVINSQLVKHNPPEKIALYEMAGGLLAVSIYLLVTDPFSFPNFQLNFYDGIYLILLGTICTAFALIASIYVMKELSPFTVTMTTNLEPVYGIILAFVLFNQKEKMSVGFYLGTVIILAGIFLNAYLKTKKVNNKN